MLHSLITHLFEDLLRSRNFWGHLSQPNRPAIGHTGPAQCYRERGSGVADLRMRGGPAASPTHPRPRGPRRPACSPLFTPASASPPHLPVASETVGLRDVTYGRGGSLFNRASPPGTEDALSKCWMQEWMTDG